MGALLSCACCAGCAATSLATSCCCCLGKTAASAANNDQDDASFLKSTRKQSVLLLVASIVLALTYQYGVAPAMVDASSFTISYYNQEFEVDLISDNIVVEAWLDGCTDKEWSLSTTDDAEEGMVEDVVKACVGNNAVYRVGLTSFLVFLVTTLFAFQCVTACLGTCRPCSCGIQYSVWLLLLAIITLFVPNTPLLSNVFLNFARIGAVLFIMVQQVILLDMAHAWNDAWVEQSNVAEREQGPGAGKKWLMAILVACATLFSVSFIAIVCMFVYWGGCTTNTVFIALTLVFSVLITILQLTGTDGSLLSSACITTWAAFLCYTAVTKNPDETCITFDSFGGGDSVTSTRTTRFNIALGLIVTIMSLAWTGWSYTAHDKLSTSTTPGSSNGDAAPSSSTNIQSSAPTTSTANGQDDKKVTGVVVGVSTYGTEKDDESPPAASSYANLESNGDANADTSGDDDSSAVDSSISWKLNLIMVAITCWMSMVLTNFGVISVDNNAANPQVGRASMWVVIASQWFVLLLYSWTLVAPQIFPDRDFS